MLCKPCSTPLKKQSKKRSKRPQSKNKSSNNKKVKRKTKKNQSGGAYIEMKNNWEKRTMPLLPPIIKCPLCGTQHKKSDLIYNVNSLRKTFKKKHPNGVRVRSFKLGTRRRIFKAQILTPTIFYFNCNKCNFIFHFKNITESDAKQKLKNKKD